MTGAEIGIAMAFVGGVVSFASPCCLPLMPSYVGYMVGTAGEAERRRALFHGIAFSVGFTLVFVAFWTSIGLVGYALADHARLLRQAGGAILIFLGLQMAGVINVPILWRDMRPLPVMSGGGLSGGGLSAGLNGAGLNGGGMAGARFGGVGRLGGGGAVGAASAGATPGLGRSLLFGVMFAAGWSPCIGPILGGIVGLAAAQATVAQGSILLLAYAAGLAVPFVAVAVGASWVARRLAWVSRHHRAVSLVSGALLVGLGALMVTDTLARLAAVTAPLGA